jgi:hypothetical protein
MGFKDVDRVEIDLALVLLRKLIQGGNLPPNLAHQNVDPLVCPTE